MPTRNSRLLVTKAKHNGGTNAIKGKITRRVQHEYIRPERKKNEKTISLQCNIHVKCLRMGYSIY